MCVRHGLACHFQTAGLLDWLAVLLHLCLADIAVLHQVLSEELKG